MRKPPEIRFWERVHKTDTCWNWIGNFTRKGYGRFFVDYRQRQAHRYSYELVNGQISPGMTVDHLCRNRACVNPDHMEIVDSRTNTLRGIGPTAINARKSHCKNGHELSGSNLCVDRHGYRECRTCRRAIVERMRQRNALNLKSHLEAHDTFLDNAFGRCNEYENLKQRRSK